MAKITPEQALKMCQELIGQSDELCQVLSDMHHKISFLNDAVDGEYHLPQLTEESYYQLDKLNSLRGHILQCYEIMEVTFTPLVPPPIFPNLKI